MKKCQNIIIVIFSLSMLACNEGGTDIESNRDLKSFFDVNTYSLNKLVCDPFGGDGGPQQDGGMKASLYYMEGLSSPLASVYDYIEQGTKSDKHIFFTELNVPTRRFELGFPIATGEMILTDEGNELVENFALEVQTVLSLGEGQEPGYYEFALLSDDGSVLKIKENGEYVDIVNNDGNHPTKMGCASKAIYMDYDSEFLAKIYYHQGPRYHISVIPMMRKIADAESFGQDARCGDQGNSLYFDYNNNSEPQPAYLSLLDRGWEPLKASNYDLPISVPFNPCMEGEAPIITNIFVEDLLDNQLRVAWTTDIPATSQLRIVNLDTNEEHMTFSDNILRTEHEVFVHTLQPGVNYLVQAVSISETFGKSISTALNIQIQ